MSYTAYTTGHFGSNGSNYQRPAGGERSSSGAERYHPYGRAVEQERLPGPASLYSQGFSTPQQPQLADSPVSNSHDMLDDLRAPSPLPSMTQYRRVENPGRGLAAMNVEVLASRLGLDDAARRTLHDFNEMSTGAQLVALFAYVLGAQNNVQIVTDGLVELSGKVDALQKLHIETFQPTENSIKHMRRMTRHYLTQPLHNYLLVHEATKNYYMRKPETFGIAAYGTDSAVSAVVDALLLKYGGQARSNYRKVIWKFVSQGASLKVWTDFVIRRYHFHGASGEASVMMQARLALMRQVALPLVARPTTKGQNTTFWDSMRTRLVALYKEHGPDVKTPSPAWTAWAEAIVAADKETYTQQSVELPEDDGLGGDGSGVDPGDQSGSTDDLDP